MKKAVTKKAVAKKAVAKKAASPKAAAEKAVAKKAATSKAAAKKAVAKKAATSKAVAKKAVAKKAASPKAAAEKAVAKKAATSKAAAKKAVAKKAATSKAAAKKAVAKKAAPKLLGASRGAILSAAPAPLMKDQVTPTAEFVFGEETNEQTLARNGKLKLVKSACVARADSLGLNFGQKTNKPWNCTLELLIPGNASLSVHEAAFTRFRFPTGNPIGVDCQPIGAANVANTKNLATVLKTSGITNGVWV